MINTDSYVLFPATQCTQVLQSQLCVFVVVLVLYLKVVMF